MHFGFGYVGVMLVNMAFLQKFMVKYATKMLAPL